MRDLFNQFLLYTRSQRRAVIALVVLILLVVGGTRLYHYYSYHQPVAEDSALRREVAEAMAPHRAAEEEGEVPATNDEVPAMSKNETSLFYFDPNTIGVSDWLRLGLTEKQANGIERYKSKGGTFRVAADLDRLYSLTDSDKLRLKPWVRITAAGVQQREAITHAHQTAIEINTADSAAFESLWGIGQVLSVRIIRYREALGGFYSIDQVGEVRGISDTVFAAIRPRLTVNAALVHKFSLNKADYEALRQHPYIHARIAKGITGYRKRQGDFQQIEQLKELKTVSPEMYDRLAPYLTL